MMEMANTIWTFLAEFWAIVGEMSPYLLFGFLVAGILSVMISQRTVERHVGRRGVASVFKASLFGVPLPLCSCGVIPVGMSLRRKGAGRGGTTAFLISTPQTGVDSILVTYSLLGPVFAVVRPVVALVTGMIGGMFVNAAVPEENDKQHIEYIGNSCTDASCEDGACGLPDEHAAHGNKVVAALKYGFVTLPGDIGRFLLFGLVLAAVISAVIPEHYFSNILGHGLLPLLAMTLAGIPMYVCSTASVPVAGALLAAGVSPGAALVFLMTGPATNAATITTIWKVLGRRTAVIYLGTIVVGAVVSGLLLDTVITEAAGHIHVGPHDMLPSWLTTGSAVALIALLLPTLIRRPARQDDVSESESNNEPIIELNIQGMNCSHCAANITRALEELPGVRTVSVDHVSGSGTVTGDNLDRDTLSAVVEELGYTVDRAPAHAE